MIYDNEPNQDIFSLEERCRACLLVNAGVICNFRLYRNTVKCPCKMCLVKVMCNEACEELHLARLDVYPERPEKRVRTFISGRT
jgi:hypothetical protein